MEIHFFFLSRKALFLIAAFLLLTGNTQLSYAMLEVDDSFSTMQNSVVKGQVVDPNGEPVIGAMDFCAVTSLWRLSHL